MINDLAKIKKHYGEKMMHLCATLFPTLLESDGLLFNIMSSKFAYSKALYDDIVKQKKQTEFQNFITSFVERKRNIQESDYNPFYLMEMAGYHLYECKCEEDVQKFKKYYVSDEELCTFYSDRTKDHLVFFAVRHDVDRIKRKDFLMPERQDEYGTSVISIQFTKGPCNNLSIKNRYNHSVLKSDATFSNNLDNIIPGLTDSFRKTYNLNIFCNDVDFELDGYCYAKDGKYYKYNYHIGDVYYGTNNAIIDISGIIRFAKEKYLIIDYYIIDLVNKKVLLYDPSISDAFADLKNIKKISILNDDNGKKITILTDNYYVYIKVNKDNQIVSYESNIVSIGNGFLKYNRTLKAFKDDSLISVGNDFICINNILSCINLPNLQRVGDYFLSQDVVINNFSFPKLEEVGDSFLRSCSKMYVTLPSLRKTGSSFLASDHELLELDLPNLREAGCFFINFNTSLYSINMPKLEKVDHHFLTRNRKLTAVSFPKLRYIDDYFLFDNSRIDSIYMPEVLKIGDYFLQHNYRLIKLSLPKVLKIGDHFMYKNRLLEEISLTNVISIGNEFLLDNDSLKAIECPKLIVVGSDFLCNDDNINIIVLPELKKCGNYFLSKAKDVEECILKDNLTHGLFFLDTYLKRNELDGEKSLVKRSKI